MTLQRPIGHEKVLTRLFDLANRDRLPHALLFGGPRGIGKALAARWLAARLLCRSDGNEPCATCTACIQVGAASHPDFLLLEPAAGKKEIGVDVVRNARRFVQFHAVAGHRKVALAEEAERLTVAAQNALLKTLEEPPGDAVIILVTASTEALLPTVRSRCRHLGFAPLSSDDVRTVLLQRCNLPEDEASLLAAWADGSPGFALRMRDVLFGPTWKDLLHALAVLHPARYRSVAGFASALGRADQEMGVRLELLLHAYRDSALKAVTGTAAALAEDMHVGDPETAVRRAGLVAEALRTLRYGNPNRPLLAEALALRLARS